ncbi:MAG: YebC/PmpR family DNA-binding transcriptional regulator [Flavobacteriales bacterium]
MSGHSKWSSIKHKKGAKDAKRGKIFTRIIKEITIAARDGGSPDPDMNPALRLAINNAKGANMPKDNIERAIKKGSGAEADNLQEYTFEGYASNGIAVFVEATSDNKNRVVANVRMVFSKYGGDLGTNGSLSFMFDRKGVFTIDRELLKDWELEDFEFELIDAGLEEVEVGEEEVIIYASFDSYGDMQSKLDEMKIEAKSVELQRIPTTTKELSLADAKQVLKLIDKMEEDDDVNVVYHTLEMTDELAAALEAED